MTQPPLLVSGLISPPPNMHNVPLTITSASQSLSAYLLIFQIAPKDTHGAVNADEEFANMFRRYAYLTTDEHYKRVSCFKQDDPSIPRWLVLQEFTSFVYEFPLKKKEAEYWWRKNGWEGVLVEFFQQAEND